MTTQKVTPLTSVYDIQVEDIHGNSMNLSQFKGRKMLIVNTASECGFTPQYKQLQELFDKYGDKIVVLAFPSNDFGAQEPADNQTINEFCQVRFGVSFPLFAKISVKGPAKHPLYAWLSDASQNGWNNQEPAWNFCKYFVDEDGHLLNYFNSSVDPLDKQITG